MSERFRNAIWFIALVVIFFLALCVVSRAQTHASASVTYVAGTTKTLATITLTYATSTTGITFSGKVSGGAVAPTGYVSLLEDGGLIAQIPLKAGAYSYVLPGMAPGAHEITAVYSGDGNYY